MKKPRFWIILLRMALLMAVAFVVVMVVVRGKTAMLLMFSGMHLTALLEDWMYRPLMAWVSSERRLESALWLMLLVSYVQWTLLASVLAYAWQRWRYQRTIAKEHT